MYMLSALDFKWKANFIKVLQKTNKRYVEEEELDFDFDNNVVWDESNRLHRSIHFD